MKKMLLVLSLCFAASAAFAAGDPIPGVDVSLQQIPGGIYHTQGDCLNQGGSIVHKHGNTFCHSTIKKRGRSKLTVSDEGRHKHSVANTETGDDGSYKFTRPKSYTGGHSIKGGKVHEAAHVLQQ